MRFVDLHEVAANIEMLVEEIEDGRESDILIVRDGKPVARLTAVRRDTSRRIGSAKGRIEVPADIDAFDAEVGELFGVDE